MKIAVVFHSLFVLGDPPEFHPIGASIIQNQMEVLRESGLLDACDEFYVGINGGEESQMYADSILPEKAVKIYHGLQARNEIRTIMFLHQMMMGRKGWAVLYFMPKGFSHALTDQMTYNWRECMQHHLVRNWEICIESLKMGADMAGCHWKTEQVDGKQNLWAGNFWWSKSEYLSTLPPIENNPRIPLMGGIDSFQSRYEAEVWVGSGRRRPKVVDYHPSGPFTCGR